MMRRIWQTASAMVVMAMLGLVVGCGPKDNAPTAQPADAGMARPRPADGKPGDPQIGVKAKKAFPEAR
jgi:hypothetical protein